MQSSESIQRVRIYLRHDDQWQGKPRYQAIMDQLRGAGASGATAFQALAGFGPGQRVRAGTIAPPEQHHPVVIEWVDYAERVARMLPMLDSLLTQTLITVEDVAVYRAVLRSGGPFSTDRTVGDTMRTPPPAVMAEASLGEALTALIAHQISALPITDDGGMLVGLLSEQELAWRAGLRLPIALIRKLTPAERDALLAPLIGRAVRELMNTEPRSVLLVTSLPQALVPMVEWGYAQIPVVDRDGRLAGIIGQADVLRAAIERAGPADSAVSPAEPPVSVGLVMQTIAPQLTLGEPLALAIDQLIVTPARRILIVDSDGRLRGTIDLAGTLEALAGAERAALIAALQRPPTTPTTIGADRTLDALAVLDPPTLGPDVPVERAAQRLLELGAESMPVVDVDGRLLGIIARGGLIRALLQQSE